MRKGRITIPTDENYVEGTKKIADLWGADAVRDCDGVKLPKNPKEIADKVYNVYFVDRGNHEWAKNNPDEWQHMFIMTPFITATENPLIVRLMDTFYAEQVKPDLTPDAIKHIEVIDRTTGEVWTDWTVDEKNESVIINNAKLFHQYTVAFLGISKDTPFTAFTVPLSEKKLVSRLSISITLFSSSITEVYSLSESLRLLRLS